MGKKKTTNNPLQNTPKNAAPTRRNVSFELPPSLFELLERAAEEHGQSRHQRARSILIESLQGEAWQNELMENLMESSEMHKLLVTRLEELLRRAVYGIFTSVGSLPSDKANQWILRHMPPDLEVPHLGSSSNHSR